MVSRYVRLDAERDTTIVPRPSGASSGRGATTCLGTTIFITSEECTTAPAYLPPSIRYQVAFPATASPWTSDKTLTRSPGASVPTTGAFVVAAARTLA